MPEANPKTDADKAPKAPAKKEYIVLSPLDHDGERYAVDEKVELTKKQADELIACGTVKAA